MAEQKQMADKPAWRPRSVRIVVLLRHVSDVAADAIFAFLRLDEPTSVQVHALGMPPRTVGHGLLVGAEETYEGEQIPARHAARGDAMDGRLPEWLRRWMSGQSPSASTGIDGGPTYGYGTLCDNGYWEIPVPVKFMEAHMIHVGRVVARQGLARDAERLDFLTEQSVESTIAVRPIRENPPGGRDETSKRFREGHRVEVFTVVSQHAYGRDLRSAIDAAVKQSSTQKKEQ